MFPRRDLLDIVLVEGRARGIVVRNMITGELESHAADAVVLPRGYGNVFYLSTNGEGLQRHGHVARAPQGRPSPTRATPRSTPPASAGRRTTSRS